LTHSCGVGGGAEGAGLGLGDVLRLVGGPGIEDELEPVVSGPLAGGVVISVDGVLGEGVSVDEGLGEGVSVDEVLGESVGEMLSLGEAESLGVRAISCAVRTSGDAGGDAQIVLAEVVPVAVMAARTAKLVKIMPVPKNAKPTIAPRAAGFRSSALTGCNLASLSRPGTTLVTRHRHSTHGLRSDSRYRGSDTKGS